MNLNRNQKIVLSIGLLVLVLIFVSLFFIKRKNTDSTPGAESSEFFQVDILTFPSDAKVTIDDQVFTNGKHKIKQGYHVITLERFGFQTVIQPINIQYDGYFAYSMLPIIPETKEWVNNNQAEQLKTLNLIDKQYELVDKHKEKIFPIIGQLKSTSGCRVSGGPNLYNIMTIYFQGETKPCLEAYRKLNQDYPLKEYDTFLINSSANQSEIWRPSLNESK